MITEILCPHPQVRILVNCIHTYLQLVTSQRPPVVDELPLSMIIFIIRWNDIAILYYTPCLGGHFISSCIIKSTKVHS